MFFFGRVGFNQLFSELVFLTEEYLKSLVYAEKPETIEAEQISIIKLSSWP